jgi:hypothetical protein
MGHKCATGRYLLLIMELESEEETENIIVEPESDANPDDNEPLYFHLSPQALTGQSSTDTL